MTPAARIAAAIDILEAVLASEKPADTVAATYFRTRRFIGSKDRAAINTRLYRIIRSWHRLTWHIGGEATARKLVLADLMFGRECNLESIDDLFSGERFAPTPLSKDERSLVGGLEKKTLDDNSMPLQLRTECPEWAFVPLQRALGKDYEAELRKSLEQAPLDLRVNTLKAMRGDVLKRLRGEGFDAEAGNLSPLCIRLFNRPQIMNHPLYLNGAVEIQDEGSQMVAVLADAKPGEQVVDFCAGAGGKTMALGASMENKGRILAMDVLERRLTQAKLRFRRAGLHNAETRVIEDKWIKRHAGHFDLVLVDAPCSGTGTWRRDPDRRWRHMGPDLEALRATQAEILEKAQRLVKAGGRLVYATCSLLNEENEDQIEKFLATHKDFTLKGEMLRLSPLKNDTDGFFGAVLLRN